MYATSPNQRSPRITKRKITDVFMPAVFYILAKITKNSQTSKTRLRFALRRIDVVIDREASRGGRGLDFNEEMQALMITLYIAMDSFGTACNVTGDGAIAIAIDRITRRGGKSA